MKRFQRESVLFLLLSLLTLTACSHKPPASRVDREKWNHATLNGSYETIGSRNPKWDKDATDGLNYYAKSRTATDDEKTTLYELVGDATDNAVAAGCDDPMIRYLNLLFSSQISAKPFNERQALYREAANKLEGSGYPPIRKFYANVDAAEILWARRETNLWPQVNQHRAAAVSDLTQALLEPSLPEAEAYGAADTLFEMLTHNPQEMSNAYNQIASALAQKPDKAAMAEFIKATYYIQYAWQGRGHGTANQVTQEGWRLFHERLGIAEKALNRAWSLDPQDPQIPTLMISIVLGQNTGRPEMEKWFARAMKADPNNYQACRDKLHFLLPEWNGSRDDMLEFGRECVASTNWGGQVPLILVDAHIDIDREFSGDERHAYWSLPDVWPDIKAGYEKFAALNPDETHFRYPYAWYAFSCGQTNDFVEQINLIRKNDGEVRYSYFGGKEAFDKVWAMATGTDVTNTPTVK